jgi:hypothetical protein
MSFCSFLEPLFDAIQSLLNALFSWAPSFGLSVPDISTLFGNLISCGTTTAG